MDTDYFFVVYTVTGRLLILQLYLFWNVFLQLGVTYENAMQPDCVFLHIQACTVYSTSGVLLLSLKQTVSFKQNQWTNTTALMNAEAGWRILLNAGRL